MHVRVVVALLLPIGLLVACTSARPSALPTAASSTPVVTTTAPAVNATVPVAGPPTGSVSATAPTSPAPTSTAAASTSPVATATAPTPPPLPATPTPRAPAVVATTIANFAFEPAGGTAPLIVRWTNSDPVDH